LFKLIPDVISYSMDAVAKDILCDIIKQEKTPIFSHSTLAC